jgi:prepilin-type N-terminal cleavage/methylation domain-containing protein
MPVITRPLRSAIGRSRPGFTLAEMLVVMVLLTIVGGSLMNVLSKQQRFYRGVSDLGDLRSQLRQAEAVMSSDIRGMSSIQGDIVAMSDSSIDFRYTIGSSIVCTKAPSIVTLPPLTLQSGNTLTSWIQKPEVGDSVWIFDEGNNASASTDDTWQGNKITGFVPSPGACPPPTYTALADATSNSWTMTLQSTLSNTIPVGAAMRFVRRAHYSLYHTTSTSPWYLGYTCSACGTGATIQPIAGPFNGYTDVQTPDTSGIRFTYFDSTGAVATLPAQVARINIVIRGHTRAYLNVPGLKQGIYYDSVRTDIAVRNRS